MQKIHLPLITALLFSGSFVAAKYTTADLGPLTTTFLRYIFAFIFLVSIYFFHKPSSLRILRKDISKIVLLAVFGVVGFHFFFFSSLKYTSVANTGVINAFIPIATGLVAAIFIGEKLSKRSYAGIFLALIGVLFLVTKGDIQLIMRLELNIGDIFMFFATICWAVYSVIVKSLSKRYDVFVLTLYATALGVLMLFFLTILEGGLSQIQTVSVISIVSVIYMGILSSGLGYLLYNYGIKTLGPTKNASLVYSGVPIFVAILSFLFFNEVLTLSMIISVIMIIIGLNLALSSSEQTKENSRTINYIKHN